MLQAAGMANGEHGTGVEGKTSKSPDEGNENQEDASDDVEGNGFSEASSPEEESDESLDDEILSEDERLQSSDPLKL